MSANGAFKRERNFTTVQLDGLPFGLDYVCKWITCAGLKIPLRVRGASQEGFLDRIYRIDRIKKGAGE
jgi:hypothetical protein